MGLEQALLQKVQGRNVPLLQGHPELTPPPSRPPERFRAPGPAPRPGDAAGLTPTAGNAPPSAPLPLLQAPTSPSPAQTLPVPQTPASSPKSSSARLCAPPRIPRRGGRGPGGPRGGRRGVSEEAAAPRNGAEGRGWSPALRARWEARTGCACACARRAMPAAACWGGGEKSLKHARLALLSLSPEKKKKNQARDQPKKEPGSTRDLNWPSLHLWLGSQERSLRGSAALAGHYRTYTSTAH